MVKAKDPKYVYIWSNTQGISTLEGASGAFINYRQNSWNKVNRSVYVSKNNRITCYISKRDIDYNTKLGKSFFDQSYRKQFFKEIKAVTVEHWGMFRKLSSIDFSKLTTEEIVDWIERAVDQYAKTVGYFHATQQEGTEFLMEKIMEVIDPKEAEILLKSPDMEPIAEEHLDWQKILQKKFEEEKIVSHLQKYPWVAAVHFTMKDAIYTLKERYDHDKKNLIVQDIKAEKKQLKKEQEKILQKHPKIRDLINLSHQLALSRIQIKVCWNGNDFYLLPAYEELSKRTGETADDLYKYYLTRDLRKLIDGKKLSKKEKVERKSYTVFLWKKPKLTIAFGQKAKKLEKQELGKLIKTERIMELQGVSANPGVVRGHVKILEANNVEKTRDFRSSFKQGEILVTDMTQPNIVDIAKKAGAIVTDEGGMLSHAAIISREFGIPCIVGTHNATRVLKDGDRVEVNADKGVVTIIKHA